MKLVRNHIEARQAQFAEITFFDQLTQHQSPDDTLWFVRGLTFFVMAFQDVLRLNEERVQAPAMQVIARHHRLEDKGHDLWFLHDVAAIDTNVPDTGELFSVAHASTRDVAYEIMSEVFRASDDETRIALLLVLESTGHVFFTRVVEHLERVGCMHKLRYFARKHLDIELGHSLFEAELDATIDAIDLDEEHRARVMACVDRSFDAMARMLDRVAERAANSIPPSRRTSLPPISSRNSVPPVSTRVSNTVPPVSTVVAREKPESLASLYKLASNQDS